MNFDNINKWLKDKKNIWVIGEREWSAKLARDFYKEYKKDGKYQEIANELKGVFLLLNLPKKMEDLKNCTRLYFFNKNEQLFALKEGDKFLIKECNTSGKRINFKTITNIKQSKEYYKFKFAAQIGVIPESLNDNSIFVILNEESGEWRLAHE